MRVRYEFKKDTGFKITEKNLIDLEKLIKERISNEIIYTVYLRKNHSFDTKELKNVLEERNNENNKILSIVIKTEYSSDCNLNLELSFSDSWGNERTPKVKLSINGENREFIRNFSNKLEEYLVDEIIFSNGVINHIISILNDKNVFYAVWFLSVVISVLNNQLYSYFVLASILFSIHVIFVKINILPNAIFCIGKEKENFEMIKQRRTQIFWVILIGLPIGIVASIVASKL
ncbi:MAG: hypothetical protein ACRC80_23705 [Waterburya sp.]